MNYFRDLSTVTLALFISGLSVFCSAQDDHTVLLYTFETGTGKVVKDLSGQAKITHETTNLEAGFVSIDWKTNILNALPSKSKKINSKPILPVINEKGKDPMTGDQIIYNTKSKKGKMLKGSTKADDGYYTGSEIRNESNKVVFIQNSTYTTCNLETPISILNLQK